MIDPLQWQYSPSTVPVQDQASNVSATEPLQSQTNSNVDQYKDSDEHISEEKVKRVVDDLNQSLVGANTHLKFQFHEKLQKYYVAIIDDQTNEVIKEIPPKKLLDTYADMMGHLGLLVNTKA